MAMPGQPPAQGGLGAMAPRPQAQAQAPNPAQDAARISSMEQEQTPQDMMDRAIQKQREAREALENQMRLLRESADIRMNMPFDTSLMAAASGFLKPTKTGSFGESLGYAAEAYASDADKALLRKQQAAKQQLELAQAEQAMGSKNLEFEHMLKMAGVDPSRATTLAGPTAPSPQAGTPAGVAPAAPGAAPQAAPAQTYGQTGAPNEMPPISDRDITTAYAISKEHGDKIAAIAKAQREDLIVNEGNVFSRSQRKFLDVTPPNEKPGEFDFGPAGARKTSPEVYREYRKILGTGDQEKLLDFYVRQGWLAGATKPAGTSPTGQPSTTNAPTTVPSGGSAKNPLGLPTAFESKQEEEQRKRREAIEDAAQKASREALEKLRAESGEKRASNLIGLGESAQITRNLAKDMNSFAKSNPRIFDLLQSPDILDRVVKFGEQGIKFGQFGSFSIPATVLAQNKYLGITQGDLDALQMFAQANAKLTVELRKQSRSPGEGSTTESEGTLYATVEALPSNSSRVILLKNDLLELRSDFNEQAAKLWVEYSEKNPGKSFDSFRLHSQDFKELRSAYDKALDVRRKVTAEILGDKPKEGTKPAAPQSAAPTAAPTAAGNKPNERVIGGTVWERKPDGSWNNTGRKP